MDDIMETGDLIERLKFLGDDFPTCKEAAEEITRLSAQVEDLKGRDALRDRTAMERDKRIAELEAALRPFAKEALQQEPTFMRHDLNTAIEVLEGK